MKKVVCIDNYDYEGELTISKTYEIVDEDKYFYNIIDNNDFTCICEKECFKKLSEIRNEKIDKLLNL